MGDIADEHTGYLREDFGIDHTGRSSEQLPPFTIENAECMREKPKALEIWAPKFQKAAFWVPKSQVHDDSEVYKEGDRGTLIISGWLAEQKGWI